MQWLKQSGVILGTALASAIFTYKFSHTPENRTAVEVNKAATIEPPTPLTYPAECLPDQTTSTTSSNIAQAKKKKSPGLTSELSESENETPQIATAEAMAETVAEIKKSLTKEITQEVYERIDREQQHVDTIREFLESQKSGNHNQVLQERYENEEIDYDWAVQKEDQIYQILDTNETLSHIAPLGVSCKSENCQVILPSNDQKEASQIFEQFLSATSSNDDGSPQLAVSYFADPDSGELTLYISEMGSNSLFENSNE